MPKAPPSCRKCGKQHWHFHACEKAPEYHPHRSPQLENQKPRPGLRPWGEDRLETVQHQGGNVLVFPRKLAPRRPVLPPNEAA